MREYAESLGDKDNKADGEKQNIMHMVNQIWTQPWLLWSCHGYCYHGLVTMVNPRYLRIKH